jgi:hypothetical protein
VFQARAGLYGYDRHRRLLELLVENYTVVDSPEGHISKFLLLGNGRRASNWIVGPYSVGPARTQEVIDRNDECATAGGGTIGRSLFSAGRVRIYLPRGLCVSDGAKKK